MNTLHPTFQNIVRTFELDAPATPPVAAPAPAAPQPQPSAAGAHLTEARRSGLTVGRLRKLIERLPCDMDVRFFASVADECHVNFAETYKDSRGGTLMLADTGTPGAGSTIIFDVTGE
jgi:hypothetical protein